MSNANGPDQKTLDILGLNIYEDPLDGKMVRDSSIYAIQDLLDNWRDDGNKRNSLMVLTLMPSGDVCVSRADRLVFPNLDTMAPERITDFKNGQIAYPPFFFKVTGTEQSEEKQVLLFKTAGPNSIKIVETDNVFRIPTSEIWVTYITRAQMAESEDLEGY